MDYLFADDKWLDIIFLLLILFLIIISVLLNVIVMIYGKNNGAKKWGLALLPIGYEYVLGQLADQYSNKRFKLWFPLASCVPLITSVLSLGFAFSTFFTESETGFEIFAILNLISSILSLAAYVLGIFVFYFIFAYKNKQSAPVWTILTVILHFPIYIFMLAFSKKPGIPKEQLPKTEKEVYDSAQY